MTLLELMKPDLQVHVRLISENRNRLQISVIITFCQKLVFLNMISVTEISVIVLYWLPS